MCEEIRSQLGGEKRLQRARRSVEGEKTLEKTTEVLVLICRAKPAAGNRANNAKRVRGRSLSREEMRGCQFALL